MKFTPDGERVSGNYCRPFTQGMKFMPCVNELSRVASYLWTAYLLLQGKTQHSEELIMWATIIQQPGKELLERGRGVIIVAA